MNTETLPSFVTLDVYTANASNPAMNTELTYQYRCAGNYKKSKTLIMPGVITVQQITAIFDNCYKDMEESDFLPRQVGLQALCPSYEDEDYDDELDHAIHSIIELTLTTEPSNTPMTNEELVRRFVKVGPTGWDLMEFGN